MNQWILATEDARKSLELDPNLLKGHFFLGLALLELEKYEDAIKHIHKGMRFFFKNKICILILLHQILIKLMN